MQRLIPTRIICLTEAVTDDQLTDDEEYEDIIEELREEGRRFGNLVNVVVPRPNRKHYYTPGVEKVFLEYADVDDASIARLGMNGRFCRVSRNHIVALYYPEDKYAQGHFDG
ncbi:unnamed protein product [Thlaspi arvense]|uniref:Uncharacterized protein n=1 Tax=Thlaspi arvense TaxID=13288 RepID=A0AAU9SSD8_THLAR|nr:unnamed protein product [Thlaspi arvense]